MPTATARRRESEPHLDPLPSLKNYSILRAVQSLSEGRRLDGLEGEVDQEFRRRSENPGGHEKFGRGESFVVPLGAPVGIQYRDLTSSGGIGAAETPTDMPRLIDVIRAQSRVLAAGAMMINTMRGLSYHLPKITAGAIPAWITESNAPVETVPMIGQISFNPHTVGGFVDLTRRMVVQTGGAAEKIVVNDLSRSLATELDRVALNGSGVLPEPQGLVTDPDIPTVALGTNGGPPTRAAMIAMERQIADASADVGDLAWIGSPAARSAMRAIQLGSNSGEFLWSDEGTVIQYAAFSTKNMPENLLKGTGSNLSALILGHWPDLAIGTWGGINILVDNFTFSVSGGRRIVALWDVDVHPRHNESFVKVLDMVTT